MKRKLKRLEQILSQSPSWTFDKYCFYWFEQPAKKKLYAYQYKNGDVVFSSEVEKRDNGITKRAPVWDIEYSKEGAE